MERNGWKHQLKKSISSHEQDETRKRQQQRRRRHRRHKKNQRNKKKRQLDNRKRTHYFDAFETDYVDFGGLIGQDGAFSWHANYSPD